MSYTIKLKNLLGQLEHDEEYLALKSKYNDGTATVEEAIKYETLNKIKWGLFDILNNLGEY